MNYKRYDIVVIPPPEIAEQAIVLSRALQPLGSFYVLDGVMLYPHLSLYHVPFEELALPAVIEALGGIAATTKPFLLKQDMYYPDQGVWVGVRYVADKPILDLHTSVIAATKGQRVIENDVRYKVQWNELLPQERKNIEDCGWSSAFTLYSPHISFTKLKQPQSDVLAHLLQYDFSFPVDHIGLYELGDNGTCTRLVADFWLEKGV